jgi:dihydroflavonol-4-reductase
MKFFITGGNGFIGSHVVKKLIEQGHSVRCLLRPTSKLHRLDNLNYEIQYGDIRDKESLKQGMAGCDGVIHLASLSSWDSITEQHSDEIVIAGTQNLLEAAQAMGQLRCVYVSSAAAVNGSLQPTLHNENSSFSLTGKSYGYAIAKHRAEALCQQFVKAGLPIVIVNPTEVYGPLDTEQVTCGTLIDFLNSNPVIVPQGGTSIVHVEDVATGIIQAWKTGKSGERYILGGENLTVKELAELTLNIQGQQKPIVTLPSAVILTLAWLGKQLKIPMPFNPSIIPYAIRYWMMDNSKARHELGIEFRSARDVLEPTIQWLNANGLQ